MESNSFFERKLALTPKDMNTVGIGGVTVDSILLKQARERLEDRCSEHGFVLPGTVKLLSRSMGGFEAARFTGDAVYYVKAEGRVLYPADGLRIVGEVIRKSKMGLYVTYRNALRIQVLRDLHLGNDDFEAMMVGDLVEVEIKKSFFQINDPYILANGLFIRNAGTATGTGAGVGASAAVPMGGISLTGAAKDEELGGGVQERKESAPPASLAGAIAMNIPELIEEEAEGDGEGVEGQEENVEEDE